MIERLVMWGGVSDGNSLSHIWRHFHDTAHKLGIPSTWTDDMADARALLVPGVTVISADIWGEHIGPAVADVDYVLHNYDASHVLCQSVEPEHLLRLQVYTSDAKGDEWAPYRIYNREGRVLCQPWGTNLLSEEFHEPVFNPMSREAVFVGAVWSDVVNGVQFGSRDVLEETRLALADHGLAFKRLPKSRIGDPVPPISDEEMVNEVRAARLAPAFAGGWQVSHDLLPCRVFKNVSYGALGLSNVPAVQSLLGGWHPTAGTVAELVDSAMSLRRREYLGVVREQQRVVSTYSYRESLLAIERALEEGR